MELAELHLTVGLDSISNLLKVEKINIVIADDEPLARSRLNRLLSDTTKFNLVASASDGQQALDFISQYQPDLVILDINMPIKSGLNVAEKINSSMTRPPAVIFTTAYDEYAIEAFKVNAQAYLMKPISEEKLLSAIENASCFNRLQINNMEGLSPEKIAIKRAATIESVPLNKISHFKAQDKIVVACSSSGSESVVGYTLKELEEKLAPAFVRTHRNTLINSQFIEKISKDSDGHYGVNLKEQSDVFPVSRRQVSTLKKVFNN